MNTPSLGDLQGPLKQRYREEPDAAQLTLSATELATLQRLTERYCVVLQSIVSAPPVSTTVTA